jgi:hypothetical protein
LVVLAAAFVILTRWACFPRYLADWDSVEFAEALSRFDVTRNCPHPPGFPLFILAGRLLFACVRDEARALSLVSCLASAASVPLLWALARRWLDRGGALVLLAWWVTQPLFWYYGALHLSYPLEVVVVLTLLLVWTGGVPASLGGLAYGLAGGVRPSTWLVLGLVALRWARGLTWRERGLAAAAAALGAALWLAPTAWLSGGWHDYRVASSVVNRGFFVSQSLLGGNLRGSLEHLRHLGEYLWSGHGPWLGLIGIGLALAWNERRAHAERWRVNALWLLGGVLYCVCFHMGQPGYLLAFAPPLGVGLAVCVRRMAPQPESARRILPLVALMIGLCQSVVFLGGNGPFSAAAIARADRGWDDLGTLVRREGRPEDTLVMSFGSFRQAAWFLPAYRHVIATLLFRHPADFPLAVHNVHVSQHRRLTPERWLYPSGFQLAPWPLPPGTRRLLVVEPALTWIYHGRQPLREVTAGGARAWVLDVPPGARLVYDFGRWEVR